MGLRSHPPTSSRHLLLRGRWRTRADHEIIKHLIIGSWQADQQHWFRSRCAPGAAATEGDFKQATGITHGAPARERTSCIIKCLIIRRSAMGPGQIGSGSTSAPGAPNDQPTRIIKYLIILAPGETTGQTSAHGLPLAAAMQRGRFAQHLTAWSPPLPSSLFLQDELSDLGAVLWKEPAPADDIAKVRGPYFFSPQGPSMAAALDTAGSELLIGRLHGFRLMHVTWTDTAKMMRACNAGVDPSSGESGAWIAIAPVRTPDQGCLITMNDPAMDEHGSTGSVYWNIKHLINWSPSMGSTFFLQQKSTGYAVCLESSDAAEDALLKVLGQLSFITHECSIAAALKSVGVELQIERLPCLELMDIARATRMFHKGAGGLGSSTIAADESIPAASISTSDHEYLILQDVRVIDVQAFAASACRVIKHLIIFSNAGDPRTGQNLVAPGDSLGRPFLLHDQPVIKCLINLSLDTGSASYVRPHDYRPPSTDRCLMPPPTRLNQVARTGTTPPLTEPCSAGFSRFRGADLRGAHL